MSTAGVPRRRRSRPGRRARYRSSRSWPRASRGTSRGSPACRWISASVCSTESCRCAASSARSLPGSTRSRRSSPRSRTSRSHHGTVMIATPTRVSDDRDQRDRTAVKSSWPRRTPTARRRPAPRRRGPASGAAGRADDPGRRAAPAGRGGVVGLPPDEGAADGRQAQRADHPAEHLTDSPTRRHDHQGDAERRDRRTPAGARPRGRAARRSRPRGLRDEDPQQRVGQHAGAGHQREQRERDPHPDHRTRRCSAMPGGDAADDAAVVRDASAAADRDAVGAGSSLTDGAGAGQRELPPPHGSARCSVDPGPEEAAVSTGWARGSLHRAGPGGSAAVSGGAVHRKAVGVGLRQA